MPPKTPTPVIHYCDDSLKGEWPLEGQDAADAGIRLCTLYHQGVPFFRKDTIREILRQLAECDAASQTLASHSEAEDSDSDPGPDHAWPVISIPAIDGPPIEAEVKTGMAALRGDIKNTQFVLYVRTGEPFTRTNPPNLPVAGCARTSATSATTISAAKSPRWPPLPR